MWKNLAHIIKISTNKQTKRRLMSKTRKSTKRTYWRNTSTHFLMASLSLVLDTFLSPPTQTLDWKDALTATPGVFTSWHVFVAISTRVGGIWREDLKKLPSHQHTNAWHLGMSYFGLSVRVRVTAVTQRICYTNLPICHDGCLFVWVVGWYPLPYWIPPSSIERPWWGPDINIQAGAELCQAQYKLGQGKPAVA